MSESSGEEKHGILCSNCGARGHTHKTCIEPIISSGIVCFTISDRIDFVGRSPANPRGPTLVPEPTARRRGSGIDEERSEATERSVVDRREPNKLIKFLLIQRKHSISYIDFVRGKYSFDNVGFLHTMFRTMTRAEKEKLNTLPFDQIWNDLWTIDNKAYRHEYRHSLKKYEMIKQGMAQPDERCISLGSLISENTHINMSLEWGFPKGRREKNESDLRCAHREFQEETNYERSDYIQSEDLSEMTEEFIGTNGIAYRYVYYICRNLSGKTAVVNPYNKNQSSEIGNIGWFSYEEAIKLMKRNRRRIGVLQKIYKILLLKYKDELKSADKER
jgi:8-oxo-dGTP pyrophosphatase MutT (NUDIX family)